MMGAERRSMVITEEEKRLTAYHEGGHALVAYHCPASDPIHKATIIPRGRALGIVMRLPETDRYSHSREKLEADIAVAMGGRIAEEIVFGREKVTSGAVQDIEMATKMARAMVTRFGMSDKLGPIAYEENEEEVFLGHSVTRTKNVSEATAKAIDDEIREFVNAGFERAKKLLTDHEDQLHAIAQGLLEYETLTGEDIDAVVNGREIEHPVPEDDEAENARNSSSAVPDSGARPSGQGEPGGDPDPEPQPAS